MSRELVAFQDALVIQNVINRCSSNIEKYRVFVDGKPTQKIFLARSRKELWTLFNRWAKQNGAKDYTIGKYVGGMAWKTDLGLAEVRLETKNP